MCGLVSMRSCSRASRSGADASSDARASCARMCRRMPSWSAIPRASFATSTPMTPMRNAPKRSASTRGQADQGVLHVSIAAQRFEPAAVVLVLRAPGALRNPRKTTGFQLDNDLRHIARVRVHRLGAGPAAQRTVAAAGTLVVIERHRRDALPLDVFPDIQLGPIE